MNIADNIKKLRKSHGYTQKDLANILQVKPTAISAWESGRNKPLMDKVTIMATLFGVSTSDIVGDTFNKNDSILSLINEASSQLSPPRQEKVYNFVEEQLEEQQKENVLEFPNKGKIPTVHNSASAANPTELAYGDTVVEEEEFERVPSNADFAVPIIGDSMEPVIKNGQFVFVKEQPDVEDGEIAIVELDGVTCKEIYKDYENRTIILRSINELYEDRIVTPEQIRIIGKVIFY